MAKNISPVCDTLLDGHEPLNAKIVQNCYTRDMIRWLQLISCIVLASLSLASSSLAAPVTYVLDKKASTVRFEYDFDTNVVKGKMPVAAANIALDLRNLAKSTIDVTLDPSNAVAGFPFATGIMRGEQVLDTDRFPTIRFKSNKIRQTDSGANVDGMITIRGVTKPLSLKGQLFRQQGTDPNDRDHLAIVLTGQLSRSAFGANGYLDLVDDILRLKITAEINKAP